MTWVYRRIAHMATEVRTTIDPSEFGDDEVEHYSIPALDATGAPEVQPASEIQSAKQLLRGGEVLISRLNPRKARVLGVPQLDGKPALASGEFVVLQPRCEPRFLEYVLLAETTRQDLDGAVQSVTRSHQRIRPEQLMKMVVRVPADVARQQSIAEFLDVETARIDAIIAKKRHMIELLDQRSKAEIDAALGLQVAWPRDGIPIASRSDSPVLRLGLVAIVQTGLTLDGAREVSSDVSPAPYLRVANVQDGSIDLTELKEVRVPRHMARRSMLQPGDVLMTEGGDPDKLGRGAVWNGEVAPCLHQNHVFAVRPGDRLHPEYLALVTRSSYARAYFEVTASKTTGIASTSTSKITAFRVPVPPLAEQERLVGRWKSVNDRLMGAVRRLEDQVTLLQEHRQALVTAAVTGELEVPGVAA